MSKQLLLLTMWFPYGPGEEFLETEIHYLSMAFDRVYVLPTSYIGSRHSSPHRLPDNVELLADAMSHIQAQYAKAKPKRAFTWLGEATHRFHFYQDLWRVIAHGPRTWQRLLGFLSTSHIISEAIRMSHNSAKSPLVYSYWLSASTFSALTLRGAGYPFKVVSRAHGWDLYLERHDPPYIPLHEYMVLNVDRLFPISEHGLSYLKNRYPGAADRLVLSRLGVRKAATLSRPSRDEQIHIVTCSSMSPVKRLALWIEALALCQAPVVWYHIGTGPEKKRLQGLATHLPPHIQWHFLGEMSNEAVLHYYATNPIDLFVNVSQSEGLPVSIMEALSFSIPVMATSAGGTSELVDENNGILLPVEISAAEIASALHKFASLPMSENEKMRRTAVATWELKVSADRQYPEFAKLLLESYPGW